MLSVYKKTSVATLLTVAIAVGVTGSAFTQEGRYQILFTDIKPVEGQTSLTSIPQTVDYTVNWSLYEQNKIGEYIQVPSDRMARYEVECYEIIVDAQEKGRHTEVATRRVIGLDHVTFKGRKFDATTGFKLRGFLQAEDTDPEVESAEAQITNSVAFRYEKILGAARAREIFKFKTSASYNMFVELGSAFAKSGAVGKGAFILLFMLFGGWFPVFWGFSFPNSSPKKLNAKAVDDLIAGWQELITEAEVVKEDEDYDELPDSDKRFYIKESEYLEDPTLLEKKSILLWRKRIRPALDELVEQEEAGDYPLGRITLAGIRNHAINQSHWYASQEVDRAMDAVASSEFEKLRHKTGSTWLWNLGALAPLLGLLGTVTGIGRAFWRLGLEVLQKGEAFTNVDMIEKLGPGISEALWTTIVGLIVGVFLMGSHYAIRYRIDQRYSEWMERTADVSTRI